MYIRLLYVFKCVMFILVDEIVLLKYKSTKYYCIYTMRGTTMTILLLVMVVSSF